MYVIVRMFRYPGLLFFFLKIFILNYQFVMISV
jgi:hypothetical protein